MKKTILAVSLVFAILACGGKKEEVKSDDESGAYDDYETAEEEDATNETSSEQDLIAQGQALINESDCKTCHHNSNKIIGPAYEEVAKKYEFTRANVILLSGKVINGGSGVWGEIPMTAHPDLSQADAEKMSMYVLSLDGEKMKE